MKSALSAYGYSALSFLLNFIAVFVYIRIAGFQAYGAYSIYLILMALLVLLETSLVKTALTMHARAGGAESARLGAERFIVSYKFILALACVPLTVLGNYVFPADATTGVGGSLVMVVVLLESALSSPFNQLTFRLTLAKRFATIYAWRLAATFVRHICAWTTLLLTGSIRYAIVAIVIKGVIVGGGSLIAMRRDDGGVRPASALAQPARWADYFALAQIFVTVALLLVIKEAPSAYVNRIHGQTIFGIYRTLYDLVNPVWFIATVYPTMLFTFFLPRDGRLVRAEAAAKFEPLAYKLALFHLCYAAAVWTLISGEILFSGRIFPQMPFAYGVVGGVCLMGYNNFLLEAAQAFGLLFRALGAILATLAVVIGLLFFGPRLDNAGEIAYVWVVSQLALLVLLRGLLFLEALDAHAGSLLDVLVLGAPVILIVALNNWISTPALFAITSTLALIGGVFFVYSMRSYIARFRMLKTRSA
jgi:hypothetical protein